MIIGLCGRRGVGKDYVADRIVKIVGGSGRPIVRKAFADAPKYLLAAALGVSISAIDRLKDDGTVSTAMPNDRPPEAQLPLVYMAGDGLGPHDISRRTVRQALKGLAESSKDVFGPKVWVDALFSDTDSMLDRDTLTLVTDVRFAAELKALRERNAIIIRVVGDRCTMDSDEDFVDVIEPHLTIRNYTNRNAMELNDDIEAVNRLIEAYLDLDHKIGAYAVA